MHAPYRVRRVRTTALVASIGLGAAALAFAPAPARASGFLFTKFGGDQGQPALGSPFSVHYNPGAIGDVKGTQLVVDGMFAFRAASYDRPASALSPSAGKAATDPVYVAANTGKAKSNGLQGAPYLGVTTDFGGSLPIFAGFASYVPEGGYASYAHNAAWQNDKRAPGAYDGPQRWSLVSGTHVSWWNTLAVGAHVEPARLSVGLSASLVYDTLTSLIARNADSSDDLRVEGRSLITASGVHVALGLGLLWKPLADGSLRVGASFTSRQGVGSMRLSGSLRTQFGTGKEETQDTDMLMNLPDVFRLGAAYRASPKLDLRFDVEWVRWSNLQRQCIVVSGGACNLNPDGSEAKAALADSQVLLNIDRRWKDAVGVRAGVGYFVDEALELTGSLGFDTSAVPKAQLDATYLDGFKLVGSVGGRYRFSERWFLGATLIEMFMLPVDNSDSAACYHPTACSASNTKSAQPSRSPSNIGKYTQSITFLDVNVGAKF